jgi:hypothetical protein
LLLQIRGAVAEYERVLITQRMRRGRLHRWQAGVLLPWSVPPYGYRLGIERPRDPAGVWIEPTEGVLVQAVFTRYLTPRSSLDGLAKWLRVFPRRRASSCGARRHCAGCCAIPRRLGRSTRARPRDGRAVGVSQRSAR